MLSLLLNKGEFTSLSVVARSKCGEIQKKVTRVKIRRFFPRILDPARHIGPSARPPQAACGERLMLLFAIPKKNMSSLMLE
ncbi:hypothetical protein, partial [Escherichia coli]|uniref:hypothetical protein n=1 Tax=Escherichia coli TaxID=562 RepID=UPI001BC8AD53